MQRKQAPQALLAAAALVVLAACADAGAAPPPSPGTSAALAVDLGGSSRVRRIAGLAGEGEGYGTVPTAPATSQASGTADHSGHGPMPGMAQAPRAPAHDMSSHGRSNPPQTAQAGHVTGTGTVNSVDAAGRKVNLAHNAIPSIGWPAMTMDFAVAPSVDLGSLKPGTRVDFMMMQGSGGMYVIQSITPQGGR